jgi:hypothetical protein
MMATCQKRTMSEIQRSAELTSVEREPRFSQDIKLPTGESSERESSSTNVDDLDILGECSDTEDVFETTTQ